MTDWIKTPGRLLQDGGLELLAPAKLNLGLRVLKKRPDGYHDLSTIFQLTDLCDRLVLHLRRDGQLRLRLEPEDSLPGDVDNLALVAARALKDACSVSQGADILLEKRIPAGAGLGGGSSDAAAVLAGLQRLWQLQDASGIAMHIAKQLGADVPLFLCGHSAFGRERGDVLTPVCLPAGYYLLAVPKERFATARMFAQLADGRLQEAEEPPDICAHLAALETVGNDFLPLALKSEAAAALYRQLRTIGRPHLTGTGSGFFVRCKGLKEAKAALRLLPEHLRVKTLRGCNLSPLYQSRPEAGKI